MSKKLAALALAVMSISAPAFAALPGDFAEYCPEDFTTQVTSLAGGVHAVCVAEPAVYVTNGQALDAAQKTADLKQRELCSGRDPIEVENKVYVNRRGLSVFVLNFSKCR